VRLEELSPFDTFASRDLAAESDPLTSAAVFAGLIDATLGRSDRRDSREHQGVR